MTVRSDLNGGAVRPVIRSVAGLWFVLVVVGVIWGPWLSQDWQRWSTAFLAIAVWGLNLLVLVLGVRPPYSLLRLPVLSVGFGFLMSVVGSGSYWATTLLFPAYRVNIERAALFVAICTLFSLLGCIAISRVMSDAGQTRPPRYVWDWPRLEAITYVLFGMCLIGTYVSIKKIGYVPIVAGDPESLRVEFPAIAGVWLRLSYLGTVVGLLAAVRICSGGAPLRLWIIGFVALMSASLFGNRFFAAMPIGAAMLLWNQTRARVTLRSLAAALLLGMPVLALIGFWRQQDVGVGLLSPATLILYGSLGEFRDIGWTLDFYSSGHALLHGSTLGGLVVPLLPSPVWTVMGVDKAALFAHSNAAVLAQEMGQVAAQRVGVYGELFMNFGWFGALIGACVYGILIGYLDRRFLKVRDAGMVRGVIIAVIGAAAVYAQVGQWNMFTSTVTSMCYPILLFTLVAARKVSEA